jgi:hypothetical protein
VSAHQHDPNQPAVAALTRTPFPEEPDKGKAAADRIAGHYPGANLALQELDLASLTSIKSAAQQLRFSHDHIDLLINNAGVMMTPKSATADGFELQFGTNHLGHFALTGLLIDRLLNTPDSRVVTVSSVGHRFGRVHFDNLQSERSYNKNTAYAQSKLAKVTKVYVPPRLGSCFSTWRRKSGLLSIPDGYSACSPPAPAHSALFTGSLDARRSSGASALVRVSKSDSLSWLSSAARAVIRLANDSR